MVLTNKGGWLYFLGETDFKTDEKLEKQITTVLYPNEKMITKLEIHATL